MYLQHKHLLGCVFVFFCASFISRTQKANKREQIQDYTLKCSPLTYTQELSTNKQILSLKVRTKGSWGTNKHPMDDYLPLGTLETESIMRAAWWLPEILNLTTRIIVGHVVHPYVALCPSLTSDTAHLGACLFFI